YISARLDCVAFFFQAADGIRAFHVTGVQTCALPISRRSPPPERVLAVETGACPHTVIREDPTLNIEAADFLERRFPGLDVVLIRSEERRVGKEGMCRGRGYAAAEEVAGLGGLVTSYR